MFIIWNHHSNSPSTFLSNSSRRPQPLIKQPTQQTGGRNLQAYMASRPHHHNKEALNEALFLSARLSFSAIRLAPYPTCMYVEQSTMLRSSMALGEFGRRRAVRLAVAHAATNWVPTHSSLLSSEDNGTARTYNISAAACKPPIIELAGHVGT